MKRTVITHKNNSACLTRSYRIGRLSIILLLFSILCIKANDTYTDFSNNTQQQPGKIQGYISEAATGEPIGYANIAIKGTTVGTISDNRGFYSLDHIQPGTHQLRVSFIGYSNYDVSVEVRDGEVVEQDIKLSFTTIQGEEVTITAMARGQAKAINTQITATNIKNVISEQKIRELPDANAAEALARLPGVSVSREGGEAVEIKVRGVGANTMYVNGMRLDGGLRSINSSMIGSIELSKAFMPDQDADVLGGNVEFKMREALPGFRKDIWVRTGYNGFTKSFKMQDVSALLSNRFFNDRLGVLVSLSYDRKDRGRDVTTASYQAIGSGKDSEVIKQVEIRGVNLYQTASLNNRFGATLYTDYRLKHGKLYYQLFSSRLISETNNLSNGYDEPSGYMFYSSSSYRSEEQSFLHGLGGEHELLGAKIDWGLSMSKTREEIPRILNYKARNTEGLEGIIAVDSTTTIPEFMAFGTHDIDLTIAADMSIADSKRESDELAARLNVEIPFRLGRKIDGYMKFGSKFRDMGRSYDRNRSYGGIRLDSHEDLGLVIPGLNPNIDWTSTPNGWLLHEGFAAIPYENEFSMFGANTYFFPDFEVVDQVASSVDDLLTHYPESDQDDHTNSEQYIAAYVMTGIDIGDIITFTPGIRYEKLTYTTTARRTLVAEATGNVETAGSVIDTTGGHFNENFFPMFHIKIKPTKWFDIRLAATKTATRPAFLQMSPKYYRDMSMNVTKGDVYLKPQINYNYDIQFSFYTGKIGLFTIGAFYKKMENQILDYTVRMLAPTEYGFDTVYYNKNFTFPQNNQWPGYVRGLEIDWQTHFSFLPKPFNGIVLNINMAYMQSETRYPFYSFERIMIDEPPWAISVGQHDSRVNKVIGMPDMTGNIALGYELGGFAGRISAYYQSSTITVAQASQKTLDVDKAELLRLDMQLSQKFKKVPGLIIYLNINNMTNNPDAQYLTYHPERLIRDERYGTSGDIGVRYKF